jgi:hypothetical protein
MESNWHIFYIVEFFQKENYLCVKLQKFWKQKVLEAKGWFGICGVIYHSTLGIQFSHVQMRN